MSGRSAGNGAEPKAFDVKKTVSTKPASNVPASSGSLNGYASIVDPVGLDVRQDSQRNKRHERLQTDTDRVDGLITGKITVDKADDDNVDETFPTESVQNESNVVDWGGPDDSDMEWSSPSTPEMEPRHE